MVRVRADLRPEMGSTLEGVDVVGKSQDRLRVGWSTEV